MPIALVSLVDNNRQFFKSQQGLDTNFTDRKSSFCAWWVRARACGRRGHQCTCARAQCMPGSHAHTLSRARAPPRRTLLPQHPEVLVVENALADARFAANPLVTGPPDIRFYAGCPLVASNKLRLGSL